jgi:hypothetical protein
MKFINALWKKCNFFNIKTSFAYNIHYSLRYNLELFRVHTFIMYTLSFNKNLFTTIRKINATEFYSNINKYKKVIFCGIIWRHNICPRRWYPYLRLLGVTGWKTTN